MWLTFAICSIFSYVQYFHTVKTNISMYHQKSKKKKKEHWQNPKDFSCNTLITHTPTFSKCSYYLDSQDNHFHIHFEKIYITKPCIMCSDLFYSLIIVSVRLIDPWVWSQIYVVPCFLSLLQFQIVVLYPWFCVYLNMLKCSLYVKCTKLMCSVWYIITFYMSK